MHNANKNLKTMLSAEAVNTSKIIQRSHR